MSGGWSKQEIWSKQETDKTARPYCACKYGCDHKYCVSEKMHSAILFFSLLLMILFGLYPHSGQAADVQLVSEQAAARAVANTSVIAPDAMAATSGVVTVNMTAGDGNVQQNSTALAVSEGFSSAAIKARQHADPGSREFYQQLSAEIGAGALSGALGLVMVNQSSGNGNVQFNGAAIAVGGLGASAVIQLDDASLSDHSSGGLDSESEEQQGITDAKVSIAPGAFNGARGVVMINQAAGNNNVTSNSFTLSVKP